MVGFVACRAFTYLLQPTARQALALNALLEVQRELYNAALEERRGAWRWERRRVTKYEQYRTLTGLRAVRPDVLAFGVNVCRGTLTRLDEAFKGFYRRCGRGETPGFPRFRAECRWDSMHWPDISGWRFEEATRRLYLQGVGHIKVRVHRSVRGIPKTCTVRREGRRWRVTIFSGEVATARLPATGRQVGVDRGVTSVVATSDGLLVENPRFFTRSAGRLTTTQQRLAAKSGRGNRRRAAEAVARAHRKVRNQRTDFLHKLSRQLVDGYDKIVIEDLRVASMTRRPRPRPGGKGGHDPNGAAAKAALNRSILDAGWGRLDRMLAYKAEEAGRELIRVDPRHTSQRCARCGTIDRDSRVGAVFRCVACAHTDHADVNAARNILRAGLAQREQSHEVETAA
ncbi:MAG: RNA-guided endonuclease InsQ/TnpB family protein [Acidimicrobiia bacterium]